MKRQYKRWGKQIAALAMTAVLATSLSLSQAVPVMAASTSKQQELLDKKNQLQAELDTLRKQLDSVNQDKEDAEAQKQQYQNEANIIRQQIGVINSEIDETEQQIEQKITEIDQKQVEIEQKQAEYDERWAGFKVRMRSMQRLHDGGSIALLSSASNLYELLTFAHTLEEISSKDQEICNELENQRIDLSNQRQDLENAKADLEAELATLSDQQNQLSGKQSELAKSIQNADNTISAAEAEAQALDSSISEKEKEYNAAADAYNQALVEANRKYSDAAIKCSLNFGPALQTYKYISCQFGANGHKGVDFASPGGTNIYSIADGIVTKAEWHYSYGYFVQVYHGADSNGNTYATLYAHMIQAPNVSVGQSVSKGQVLGYVGSTGNSTGNHLHLELRVNDVRTNALNYVPH